MSLATSVRVWIMFQKSYLALILLAVLILGISQIVLFRNLQTILGDVDVGQDVAGSRNFAGGHSAQIPSTKDHRSIFPFAIILVRLEHVSSVCLSPCTMLFECFLLVGTFVCCVDTACVYVILCLCKCQCPHGDVVVDVGNDVAVIVLLPNQ